MDQATTSTAIPTRALKLEALCEYSGELRAPQPGFRHGGAWRDDGSRRTIDLQAPPCARPFAAGASRRGRPKGKIGFHGGKVEIERPRLRGFDGKELAIPQLGGRYFAGLAGTANDPYWTQMLIDATTPSVCPIDYACPRKRLGTARVSLYRNRAVCRRSVALSAARMKEWMASDLYGLDLLVIQIDAIHMDDDLILVAAMAAIRRKRQKASARPRRGCDGERRDCAGAHRQSR